MEESELLGFLITWLCELRQCIQVPRLIHSSLNPRELNSSLSLIEFKFLNFVTKPGTKQQGYFNNPVGGNG